MKRFYHAHAEKIVRGQLKQLKDNYDWFMHAKKDMGSFFVEDDASPYVINHYQTEAKLKSDYLNKLWQQAEAVKWAGIFAPITITSAIVSGLAETDVYTYRRFMHQFRHYASQNSNEEPHEVFVEQQEAWRSALARVQLEWMLLVLLNVFLMAGLFYSFRRFQVL